ncbi:MAG: efflux RND transporter periplasmic adaptor subunit [Caulobacterales bacterium]|nr:efflux RND transporter periplasmic adaptor subunit [Caulobacterales bacterium]
MGNVLQSVGRHAPTILTFAALAGLFWWGHHSGWRLAKPTVEPAHAASDAWCPEHHVPEQACMLCKKSLSKELAAKEPARHRTAGEQVRFAQIASAQVLAKAGIRVEPAIITSVAPRLRVAGETMYPPKSVARLGSRSDGIVRQVLVQVGAVVPAESLVAVVETAEVGRAKSTLMQTVTALDLARTQARRARVTVAAGIRTPADLEEIESRLRSAEVAAFDAEQALRNLGLGINASSLSGLDAASLAVRLRHLGLPEGYDDGGSANLLPVRAPLAGTVTEIRAVVGEAVEANAPLVVVADVSTLWVSLPVPAGRATQVAVGQAVAFAPAAGVAADGTVVAIAQAADPQTRLVTVWATVANAEQRLRVGIFGTATITTGAAMTAALVPAGAVQFDGDQAYVFVRRTETVFRCLPVRVLAREDGRLAVDRLADGDVIAVAGTAALFAVAFSERMGAGCCE